MAGAARAMVGLFAPAHLRAGARPTRLAAPFSARLYRPRLGTDPIAASGEPAGEGASASLGRAAIVCLGPPDPLALARATAAAAGHTVRRFDGAHGGALTAGTEWLAAPGTLSSQRLLYLLAEVGDVHLPQGGSWSGLLSALDAPGLVASLAGPGRADLPRALATLLASVPSCPGPGPALRVVVELRHGPGDWPTGRQAYQEMVDSWRACGSVPG